MLGVLIVNDAFLYQGVLFSEYFESLSTHKKCKIRLDSIEFLLKELELIYKTISLGIHPTIDDLRSFQWHNYHNKNGLQPNLKLHYTGALKIEKNEDFNQILSNVRTSRRQEYRRCLNNGFTVQESTDLDLLNSLHTKTFKRQKINRPPNEVLLVTKVAKESISKGFGKLLVCKDKQGIPASANLFLFDDSTAYYLIGANDPDYRKDGVGAYILLEQIRNFMAQGIRYIDFVGINSPLRGDFKTSFNAKPLPYYSFTLR